LNPQNKIRTFVLDPELNCHLWDNAVCSKESAHVLDRQCLTALRVAACIRLGEYSQRFLSQVHCIEGASSVQCVNGQVWVFQAVFKDALDVRMLYNVESDLEIPRQ
jgi:hypothetical protein